MTVLTKEGFCASARRAFKIIVTNLARVGALNVVASGFLIFGRLLVAGFTTLIGYIIFTSVDRYSNQELETAVASPLVPALVIFGVSYAVASMFMTVMDVAVDSMLLCFIYNEEHHRELWRSLCSQCPPIVSRILAPNAPALPTLSSPPARITPFPSCHSHGWRARGGIVLSLQGCEEGRVPWGTQWFWRIYGSVW
jgi:hypothetical protein